MIFFFAVCASLSGRAQQVSPENLDKFRIMEDSMLLTADSMYEAFIPDTRIEYSERFARQLVRTLKIPNSYYYKFDSLGKMVNIIYADDGAFRVINWEITPSKISKRYYGAVQLPSERLKLIGLNDYSEELGKGIEDSVLTNRRWFGAIYYRILSQEVQGQKIYTMFGYNASSAISNKKVLDPMYFTPEGLVFGAPIFDLRNGNSPIGRRVSRFVLEYKKDVQVTLNWDDERKVIIFDKLVSQINDPNRKYTYAPSGQYDGFRWENDAWHYMSDLIPVTILHDGEAPDEPSVTPKLNDK